MHDREIAAQILQAAICDAICAPDYHTARAAQEWCCIFHRPNYTEVGNPEPGSFIAICRILGLNWWRLSKTLSEAIEITDAPECPIYGQKPRIVHRSELGYNKENGNRETDIDGHGTSETPQSERELHLSVVPAAERSSKLH